MPEDVGDVPLLLFIGASSSLTPFDGYIGKSRSSTAVVYPHPVLLSYGYGVSDRRSAADGMLNIGRKKKLIERKGDACMCPMLLRL